MYCRNETDKDQNCHKIFALCACTIKSKNKISEFSKCQGFCHPNLFYPKNHIFSTKNLPKYKILKVCIIYLKQYYAPLLFSTLSAKNRSAGMRQSAVPHQASHHHHGHQNNKNSPQNLVPGNGTTMVPGNGTNQDPHCCSCNNCTNDTAPKDYYNMCECTSCRNLGKDL